LLDLFRILYSSHSHIDLRVETLFVSQTSGIRADSVRSEFESTR